MCACVCGARMYELPHSSLSSSLFALAIAFHGVNISSPFKASSYEVSATSSCSNRRSWRYRWAPAERTSPREPAPRFSSGTAPRWLLFCLKMNATFILSSTPRHRCLSERSAGLSVLPRLLQRALCLFTCFVKVYAGVALQEVRLFLVAEVQYQYLLRQCHVLGLLLRWIREASPAPLAPWFHGFATPFANSLQFEVGSFRWLLYDRLSWVRDSVINRLITGSHGPRQYLTLHWKITP